MDSFKKSLKQAIVEKAEGVRFEADRQPILYTPEEKELKQLQPVDRESLHLLIDSLLPSTINSRSDFREGSISIVNFGELKLLTSMMPLRLYAFIPPQGEALFSRIKSELSAPRPPLIPLDAEPDMPAFQQASHHGQFAITQVNTSAQPPRLAETIEPADANPPLPDLTMGSSDDELMAQTAYIPSGSEAARSGTQVNDSLKMSSPHLFDQPLSPLPAPVPRPLISHTDLPPEEEASAVSTVAKEPSGNHRDFQFHTEQNTVDQGHAAAQTMIGSKPHARPLPFEPIALTSEIFFGASVPGDSIERRGRLPIDPILEDMVKRRASDLHLTMEEPVVLRIDGEINRLSDSRISEDQMRDYLLPIMPPRNRAEFAQIHDTDFAYEVPGLARFRVNVFRDRMGVGAVLRQIPDKVLSADELGLSPAIRKLCELHKGLVIVTGPTGSGKSTTLAAMIDLINETRSDHIVTIEDPIEFVHKQKRCLINQREVHRHTGSFARALRAALREDPDIILIGEMRDLETVEIAIETAETGHLVFGTLHTNTAISTVDRLIDQFPADQQEQVRVMLAESLKGVVSQTLVRKKGGGRVAAQEILLVDKAVASLVREGNTHMVQNHMQTQKAKGNLQLNDALMALVTKGLIDPRDAYLKSIEKEAMIVLLQQKGINLESLKVAG